MEFHTAPTGKFPVFIQSLLFCRLSDFEYSEGYLLFLHFVLRLDSESLRMQMLLSCVCLQHAFVASVTDCRPLRELIAEAKAEVTEEIEDSKEEEEEEEEPDTPVVHSFIGVFDYCCSQHVNAIYNIFLLN